MQIITIQTTKKYCEMQYFFVFIFKSQTTPIYCNYTNSMVFRPLVGKP